MAGVAEVRTEIAGLDTRLSTRIAEGRAESPLRSAATRPPAALGPPAACPPTGRGYPPSFSRRKKKSATSTLSALPQPPGSPPTRPRGRHPQGLRRQPHPQGRRHPAGAGQRDADRPPTPPRPALADHHDAVRPRARRARSAGTAATLLRGKPLPLRGPGPHSLISRRAGLNCPRPRHMGFVINAFQGIAAVARPTGTDRTRRGRRDRRPDGPHS